MNDISENVVMVFFLLNFLWNRWLIVNKIDVYFNDFLILVFKYMRLILIYVVLWYYKLFIVSLFGICGLVFNYEWKIVF